MESLFHQAIQSFSLEKLGKKKLKKEQFKGTHRCAVKPEVQVSCHGASSSPGPLVFFLCAGNEYANHVTKRNGGSGNENGHGGTLYPRVSCCRFRPRWIRVTRALGTRLNIFRHAPSITLTLLLQTFMYQHLQQQHNTTVFSPSCIFNLVSVLVLPRMRFDGADPRNGLVHEGDALVRHISCAQA